MITATPQPSNVIDDDCEIKGKLIAELFSQTAVMFADVDGLAAWGCQRDCLERTKVACHDHGPGSLVGSRNNRFEIVYGLTQWTDNGRCVKRRESWIPAFQ
jgi:hypothetical protein